MDGWLKGLIAAACIAVLAAVGYYLWNEHTTAKARAELAQRQNVIRECEQIAKDMPWSTTAQICRENGYIR